MPDTTFPRDPARDHIAIAVREGLSMASVMARKGVPDEAIADALGHGMPDSPRAQFAGPTTVLGTGPGAWLVIDERANAGLAEILQARLAGLASVCDQSSGYVVHRVSGPGARTLVRRGAAIDVHPSCFGPGSAATTVMAHIGVILWQVDEGPTYDFATFRSFAGSFRHWLDQTAASI